MTEKLVKYIKNTGLNFKEFANFANIPYTTLMSVIKRGVENSSTTSLIKICNALNIQVEDLKDDIVSTKAVKIPVLGVIHAGLPVEAVENIIDYEEISIEMANKGEFFALKINGDSMLPTFINGDIVVVRKQSDADNGTVCVVMVNGYDATLKRIKKDENGILLIPDNPSYSTMQYSNKEIEEKPVRIIGKVVELRRSF